MRPRACRRSRAPGRINAGRREAFPKRLGAALILALAGLLPAAHAQGAGVAPQDPVQAALAQARAQQQPVLIEFHALWCDACYFMAQHVLTGPDWESLRRRAVVVDLDADTAPGRHWMQQLAVAALPSYLVLDPQGRERGRIVGEQLPADFYHRLDALLARGRTLSDWTAAVVDGSPASVAAARQALAAWHARGQAQAALAWWGGLDPALRSKLERDAAVRLRHQRLQLMAAAAAGDAAACAAAAPPVLAAELGCERAQEVRRVIDCTATLPPAQRRALLARQKVLLAQLIYARIFVSHRSCADTRGAVMTVADLDRLLGYPKAEAAMLKAALADARRRLGRDPARDRSLADDVRVYLARTGAADELDDWYKRLLAAFPGDYIYHLRYANSLVERGRFLESLPYFEQAEARAYGLNRLAVATAHVQTLQRLGHPDQARAVAEAALAAVGTDFPESAERLRALVAPPAG